MFARGYWAGKGAASSPRGREKFNWRIWRKSCRVNCVCSSCKCSVLQHPVVSLWALCMCVSVLVCVPVCQRLWGEGAGYKIKVLSSQDLRTVKRSKSNILLHFHGNKCMLVFPIFVQQRLTWRPNVTTLFKHISQKQAGKDKNIFNEYHRVLLECESFFGSRAL